METGILLLLAALGMVAGGIGTIIGAGGGFILMPIMLLIWPGTKSVELTAISLAVVFANAVSGVIAYGRMGRIDWRSAAAFAALSVPGAIFGAAVQIRRGPFDAVFGALLMAVSVFLLFRASVLARAGRGKAHPGHAHRILTDSTGQQYEWSFNMKLGLLVSLLIGPLSAIMGIGGGIIQVPIMSVYLNFPVQIAAATSTMVLMVVSLAATIYHLTDGTLLPNLDKAIPLALGAVAGAQIGARISKRIHGKWIVRILAIALAMSGVWVFAKAFWITMHH